MNNAYLKKLEENEKEYQYKMNGLLFYYNEIILPSIVEKAKKEYEDDDVEKNILSEDELKLIAINVVYKLLDKPDALKELLFFNLPKKDDKYSLLQSLIENNGHSPFFLHERRGY